MSYEADRAWSDQFLPAVRAIIGPRLLIPAPEIMDRREATDLIILRARDMTIAVRIRREGYAARYPDQFTIRASRKNGVKTELEKITEGFGDWLFYGHARGDSNVDPWFIIDLAKFRAALIRYPNLKDPKTGAMAWQKNADGATEFVAIKLSKLPPILVDQSTKQHGLFAETG